MNHYICSIRLLSNDRKNDVQSTQLRIQMGEIDLNNHISYSIIHRLRLTKFEKIRLTNTKNSATFGTIPSDDQYSRLQNHLDPNNNVFRFLIISKLSIHDVSIYHQSSVHVTILLIESFYYH